MAAPAPAGQGLPPLDRRSFFFALTAEHSEFLFPGDSKGWLSLRMLSLGFGARDEVHVLEAEGAQGEGGNAQMVAQKTAMLGVKPSLPAVSLLGTVLTPPVTFRLRSGPGPLYVSGSHLLVLEELPDLKIPETYDESALKRGKLSSEAYTQPPLPKPLQNATEALLSRPTNAARDNARAISESHKASPNKKGSSKSRATSKATSKTTSKATPKTTSKTTSRATDNTTSKTTSRATSKTTSKTTSRATDNTTSRATSRATSKTTSRTTSKTTSDKKKEQSSTRAEERASKRIKYLDMLKDKVQAKMLKSMEKGTKLPDVKFKFERFLMHCHNVTDPYMMKELWKWRKTLYF